MAEEPLVKEPLTGEMINAGMELTRRLDEANWPVVASFWYFVPEQNQWKLIFASPRLLSDGPAQAFQAIRRASAELREQFPSLKQIVIAPPDDEVVWTLGLAIDTEWTISGIRFSQNTVNGRFIEDAYLYRVALPRLSDQPAWVEPTDEIRALADKSVVIIEGNHRIPAKLRVRSADPQGANAGKCAVKAQQAMIGNTIEWTDAGTTPPPTEQINAWEKFLNKAAITSIRENEEGPQFGELILKVA
jgi:hypothetical protein